MSEITPKRLALNLAVMLSVMAGFTFLIFEVIVINQYFWILVTGAFIVLVMIQYIILRYALEKFIYDRIKLVYKAIHKQKLSKDDKKEQITNIHGDIIGKVNEEVESWANDRKEEIDELKKMEVYRREFLGNVSHELKTPLFNMQGFILTLLDGGINDPKINLDFLGKSQKNIERMITIVEDLEVISRLETGEAEGSGLGLSIVARIAELHEGALALDDAPGGQGLEATLRFPVA